MVKHWIHRSSLFTCSLAVLLLWQAKSELEALALSDVIEATRTLGSRATPSGGVWSRASSSHDPDALLTTCTNCTCLNQRTNGRTTEWRPLCHDATDLNIARTISSEMSKRKQKSHNASASGKRQRTGDNKQPSVVPLLQQHYHEVHSLRTYLVSRLPKSSKKRRRRLLHYGLQPAQDESILVDDDTVQLLDRIQVGASSPIDKRELEQLDQEISVFTQQVSESDISVSPNARQLRQSEVGSSHCRPFTCSGSS